MNAAIVGSGNIGATAFPRLEFSAYLSCLGRTEEGASDSGDYYTINDGLPQKADGNHGVMIAADRSFTLRALDN
jgi:hypothetical protein